MKNPSLLLIGLLAVATSGYAAPSILDFDSVYAGGTNTAADLERGRIVTTGWNLSGGDLDPWSPDPGTNSTYDIFDGGTGTGVRIKVANLGNPNSDSNSHPNIGVLFDSELASNKQNFQDDPDLTGRAVDPWSKGNLAGTFAQGNILIIQEDGGDGHAGGSGGSSTTANGWLDVAGYNPTGGGAECTDASIEDDSCTDYIDDEGDRPAGFFSINFDDDIRQFGFDLMDVESNNEEFVPFAPGEKPTTRAELLDNLNLMDGKGFAAAALDDQGNIIEFMSFYDLVYENSKFYDSTIEFGNNSANRIKPMAFSQGVNEIIISLGGSGAIDRLWFDTEPVPEPGTLILLGTGLVGLVAYKRRKNA